MSETSYSIRIIYYKCKVTFWNGIFIAVITCNYINERTIGTNKTKISRPSDLPGDQISEIWHPGGQSDHPACPSLISLQQ